MKPDSLFELDDAVCERARVARDKAYDGLFFSGVKSTMIYCRPICPVKPAKPENVSFYGTAAAAERAGYRPCLRCRPEAAPGSPAWIGTLASVKRAMALIGDGFLDAHSVSDLALKLGMGERHLLRLFKKHIGASPSQTAATLRLQKAKRLLDTTNMSISEIAFESGFKSIRRFNDAFKSLYGRAPSSIKRRGL